MMTKEQRSFISCGWGFLQGQHNRWLCLKGRKVKRVRDWRVFEVRDWQHYSPILKTLYSTSVLRLHLFCTALQSFYEDVPPGLHSLCITKCLILQPSIMNGQKDLFVVCIFCSYLCSCDRAALLYLRPGSLRAWIFLLGSSYAPRQQVYLIMGNYACGTSIMVQKILLSSCVSFPEA